MHRHLLGTLLLVASTSVLAGKYDTPAQISAGLIEISKDPAACARYGEMMAVNTESLAAYKRGDDKAGAAAARKGNAISPTLPAWEAYLAIGMKNAFDTTWFQKPEVVAMNKAVDAMGAACRQKKQP